MFGVFGAHAASAATLMFNTGPTYGEGIGPYRGDPLYHAPLSIWDVFPFVAAVCTETSIRVDEMRESPKLT
jgi:hypothetical protein